MEEANRKYILTQGPLPTTAGHFWLMVWEQNCRAILMLNKVIEKEQIKCHWYWPYNIGSQYAMDLSDVNLHVEQMSNEDHSYYSMRVFKYAYHFLFTLAFEMIVFPYKHSVLFIIISCNNYHNNMHGRNYFIYLGLIKYSVYTQSLAQRDNRIKSCFY